MTVITAGASRVIVAPRGPIGPQGDAGERPVYPTWAALALVSGTAGASAEVPTSDAGTHTDPVVGGTVNNSGIFSWSSSPAGWQRVADTDALSASNFANAAAASANSAANNAAATPISRAGIGSAPARPCVFRPHDMPHKL